MTRYRLDFKTREKIASYAGPTFSRCYQCGTCTAVCLLPRTIPVRRVLRKAQLGIPEIDQQVWKCVSCKYCDTSCPRGVEIASVMRGLKAMLYEEKKAPAQLNEVLWRVYEEGNPLGEPRTQRAAWLQGIELPANPGEGGVLLYTCCLAAYDKRLQNTLRSLVEILKKAGVPVTVMRDAETCCGDVIYHIGEEYFLEELAQGNVEAMEKLKPTAIVTVSPHSYNMLKHVYPRLGAKPPAPVMHHVQLLAEFINDGRIKPGRLEATVTYHDPCYLGRWNNIYEEPRTVLESIEGLKLVEMEHTKSRSLCCGGGGGSIWSENMEARSITRRRLDEARSTEASAMATACPYCIRMFEDEAKVARVDLQFPDVVELLSRSLRG